MTNTPPTEQEMTDVFSRFSAPLPPVSQPNDDRIKLSDRKKAALATAAVLLGGGAAFAAVNYDSIVAELESDTEPGGAQGTSAANLTGEPAEDDADQASPKSAPLRHNQVSAVQNGTITPSDNIDIAGNVEPNMAFGEAYATAREEVGPGGIFSWRGEVYNTYTLEEWQGLSLGQRREFLSEVGYRTPRQTEMVDTREAEPNIYEFVIDGRAALGIDDDHDGVADAILFLDDETNDLIAFMDMEGDDRIDSVFRYDTNLEQIIGQQTLEEPFLVDVQRLESWGNAAYEPVASDLSFAVNDDKTFDDNDDEDDDDDYTDDSGYVNDAEMPEMD